MIEKIFIPTVNRVDNQITYNLLPDELKKRVVMVVQAWERPQYNYDCEYLVLPDIKQYHFSDYYCLPKTRRFIYEMGKDIKYCVLDDDLNFHRRNTKYFGGEDNMEKSKRVATSQDILEMFELYDIWLDEDTVTCCGCSHIENPPSDKFYVNNSSLGSALWLNGKHFKDDLYKWDLTSIRVMEDTHFLLTLLTNGYGNRVSSEFCFSNMSVLKKSMESTVWDTQTFEQTHNDHKKIEERFPKYFKILYNEDGTRVEGGFRNYGKVKVSWSKAYKKDTPTLEDFFS
jgi:hypothetical protein